MEKHLNNVAGTTIKRNNGLYVQQPFGEKYLDRELPKLILPTPPLTPPSGETQVHVQPQIANNNSTMSPPVKFLV